MFFRDVVQTAIAATVHPAPAEAAVTSPTTVGTTTSTPEKRKQTRVSPNTAHHRNSPATSANEMVDEPLDQDPFAAEDLLSQVSSDFEQRQLEQRMAQRRVGKHISGFSFSPRAPEPRKDPLNPQQFKPMTNVGKPRSTAPKPRVVRYFPTKSFEPTTGAELEKAVHSALITKPRQVAAFNTTLPVEFQPPPPTQPLDDTKKLASTQPASQPARRKSSVFAGPDARKRSLVSANVVSLEPAFLTEVAEGDAMGREQSAGGFDGSGAQLGSGAGIAGSKSARFSFAMASKLKRRASRKRTIHELEAKLEEAEFDVLDDRDSSPPIGSQAGPDEDTHSAAASITSSPSMRRRRRFNGSKNAGSLYNITIPDFSDRGELLVHQYPQGFNVHVAVERVLCNEHPHFISRVTPDVDAFLKSEPCKKILLCFFWQTVVRMQRQQLEDELLRAHRTFENAYYEVNPRSAVHPTVEEAEEMLADRVRFVGDVSIGDLDVSPESMAFSVLYGSQSAHDNVDPLSSEAEGLPRKRSLQDPVVQSFALETKKESLAACVDDLIVARGELEDAIRFEEHAFHEMAVNFGNAFRNVAQKPSGSATRDLFPFERKEAVFSVFPTIAAHTTYYVLVKTFTNDADANLFNKRFRRDLLRNFTFWSSGITLQHVHTGHWPKPIDDEATRIANVLSSKDNITNGQYVVMKEFHKRANHSSVVFNEWLRQQQQTLNVTANDSNDAPAQNHETSMTTTSGMVGVAVNTSLTLPPITPQPATAASSRSRLGTSLSNAGNSNVVAIPLPPHQGNKQGNTATAKSPGSSKPKTVLPTLQSSKRAWFEHGSVRGELTTERTFEYGCKGAVMENTPETQRVERLRLAGAVFSITPYPIPDTMGGMLSSTAKRKTEVAVTSPFMHHYAQTVLSVDLRVVDLAGREAQPIQLTQLSGLDKFSVHLTFSKLAQPKAVQAEKAVEEMEHAELQQSRLAHQLEQEGSHFRRLEESRLQYAERIIEYQLSRRNPDFLRDAQRCETMLRDALKAPVLLISQSTAQCQHALRCYRDIMFTATQRRQILHELSIRVACKIRQMQRLRGDIWGANESSVSERKKHATVLNTSGQRSKESSGSGRQPALVIDDMDVVNTNFDTAVIPNEFPIVGQRLDDVAEKITFHQWNEIALMVRLDEETAWSNLMSDFLRRHQVIFVRDRVQFPLMRPAFLPFPVRETREANGEDNWRRHMITHNSAALKVTSIMGGKMHEGQEVGHAAAEAEAQHPTGSLLHVKLSSDLNRKLAQEGEQMHVEQLRQKLAIGFQEDHAHLQSELDEFVSRTAIGRRGRLATPPSAAEGEGMTFRDAMLLNQKLDKEGGHRESIFRIAHEMGAGGAMDGDDVARQLLSSPLGDPQQILRQVNTRTPQTKTRPNAQLTSKTLSMSGPFERRASQVARKSSHTGSWEINTQLALSASTAPLLSPPEPNHNPRGLVESPAREKQSDEGNRQVEDVRQGATSTDFSFTSTGMMTSMDMQHMLSVGPPVPRHRVSLMDPAHAIHDAFHSPAPPNGRSTATQSHRSQSLMREK